MLCGLVGICETTEGVHKGYRYSDLNGIGEFVGMNSEELAGDTLFGLVNRRDREVFPGIYYELVRNLLDCTVGLRKRRYL